jgi:hypothetical protein
MLAFFDVNEVFFDVAAGDMNRLWSPELPKKSIKHNQDLLLSKMQVLIVQSRCVFCHRYLNCVLELRLLSQ